MQRKADTQRPPGVVLDVLQKEQEQRQHKIQLEREQNVVELVRCITGQNIKQCQFGKRCWRVLCSVHPGVGDAPDAVGHKYAYAALRPEALS